MNLIPPFTRTLPEQAPNRNMPDWVACRFDGYPDFRSDLSIAGLRVVASWPGEWAWCEDSELQALLMKLAAKPAEPVQGDAWLKAEVDRRGDMLEEYGKRVQQARKAAVTAQDAIEKVWRALA